MKLYFPQISEPICFEEGIVNSLVIENSGLFFSLLQDFYLQTNGNEGFSVLSLNNTPIDFSKNAELISTFIPFDVNKKSLLNKLFAAFEKSALNETHYAETMRIFSDIEAYIQELSYDFSADIECEKMTVSSLLKAIGVHISENYDNTIEKIIDYMELVTEFEKGKVFIFVNMRSYFSDAQMEEFLKTSVMRKYMVLLIDNCEHKMLFNENRLIIDEDLCEI